MVTAQEKKNWIELFENEYLALNKSSGNNSGLMDSTYNIKKKKNWLHIANRDNDADNNRTEEKKKTKLICLPIKNSVGKWNFHCLQNWL